jgi:ATP-dependent Clp protease adaptor protein ClpS
VLLLNDDYTPMDFVVDAIPKSSSTWIAAKAMQVNIGIRFNALSSASGKCCPRRRVQTARNQPVTDAYSDSSMINAEIQANNSRAQALAGWGAARIVETPG